MGTSRRHSTSHQTTSSLTGHSLPLILRFSSGISSVTRTCLPSGPALNSTPSLIQPRSADTVADVDWMPLRLISSLTSPVIFQLPTFVMSSSRKVWTEAFSNVCLI